MGDPGSTCLGGRIQGLAKIGDLRLFGIGDLGTTDLDAELGDTCDVCVRCGEQGLQGMPGLGGASDWLGWGGHRPGKCGGTAQRLAKMRDPETAHERG
jgi:hypothetical protein